MCNTPLNDKFHDWMTDLNNYVWIQVTNISEFVLNLIEQDDRYLISNKTVTRVSDIMDFVNNEQ